MPHNPWQPDALHLVDDPALDKLLGRALAKVKAAGPVRVAVIGRRGVGKSTWVNSVRGLRPKDPGAAEVGADEVFTEQQRSAEGACYQHDGMLLQDVPGAEGSKVAEQLGEGYVRRFMLHLAGACVFVFTGVADAGMLRCALLLEQGHGVPVLLVRNKVGADCRNEVSDGNAPCLRHAFLEIRKRTCEQISGYGPQAARLAAEGRLFLIEARYRDSSVDPPYEGFQKEFHQLRHVLRGIRDSAAHARIGSALADCAEGLAKKRALQCRDAVHGHAVAAATPFLTGLARSLNTGFKVGISRDSVDAIRRDAARSFLCIFHLGEGLLEEEPGLIGLGDWPHSLLRHIPLFGGVALYGEMSAFCSDLIAKLEEIAVRKYLAAMLVTSERTKSKAE